jgi:ketosteroid isomerase-like protein
MNGEQLMRSVVAAFEKSDLRPLVAVLHDDVLWKSASAEMGGPFSFSGEYKQKKGVVEVLSQISKDYTFHRMTPKQIVSNGDTVWGLFDVSLRHDPKGRSAHSAPVRLDMAIRWLIKDGMIIEHQSFFDTAHLLMHQGQRPI